MRRVGGGTINLASFSWCVDQIAPHATFVVVVVVVIYYGTAVRGACHFN